MMVPAVVLSSHVMGLAVIRSLGKKGVPVTAVYYQKQDMGYVSRYVREKIYAPHPEKFEEEFISLLLEYGSRLGRSLLVPADDAMLSAVSRNKEMLENYYFVASPQWDIVQKIVDKKYTYALAEDNNVPAPKTFVPDSLADVESFGRAAEFPCLVKPCQSHSYYEVFKKKMVFVETLDQMISEYIKAERAGIKVMLQEYIPGNDTCGVNYNSYFWEGEPLLEFTASKVRLSPPGFGVPRVVQSRIIPEVIEFGRRFIKALGFFGYSCTEFKKDSRDGTYKLMEVNGRHNRSALLSCFCGIDFPWLEYRHLTAGEIPSQTKYKEGMYWIDEFRDVANNFTYLSRERYSFSQRAMPYLKPHVYAVFDRSDIRPFLKRCADVGKMALLKCIPAADGSDNAISKEKKI